MANRLGIDQSRGYRRAAIVSASLVAVFCGGMAMQAYRQNEDGARILTDEAKAEIKAMPARMFEPNSVTWKATMNYGGGFRVEDEHGVIVASDLSSSDTMRAAIGKARSMRKRVVFEYWAETPDGLEREEPFGPLCS